MQDYYKYGVPEKRPPKPMPEPAPENKPDYPAPLIPEWAPPGILRLSAAGESHTIIPLGHSDFAITANTYAHLEFDSKQASAEAMKWINNTSLSQALEKGVGEKPDVAGVTEVSDR